MRNWVRHGSNGGAGGHLLVVLARHTHDGIVDANNEGQLTTISGTVRALPKPEEMYSWGLTEADRDELMQRRIYVHAEAVTPHLRF